MSSYISRTLSFRRVVQWSMAICLAACFPLAGAFGQFGGGGGLGGGGGGGGLGGGGGGAGGGGTIGTSPFSGVMVDAEGVLRRVEAGEPTGRLMMERAQHARATLDQNVLRPSHLRKVSLTRLAAQFEEAIAQGHGPDDVMKHLAGLTRIRYVFYYPETQDIVIAGPAEGWVATPTGRVIGLETLQPIMELQDLIVALRTFAPATKSNSPLVYCSIDPTQDGLTRMQQFLSEIGRQIQPGDTEFIVEGLRESLGLQTISIGGVAANTHMAQVMVEADYRMKLIGIGLEQPPVRIASFVALANPASVARNALQRWYFVPDYQRIKVSDDGTAAEFVGAGVKLVGEDEVVRADGSRGASGGQSRASRKFTQSFTERYHELAEAAPIYGQLRNCIDLLVTAAFIQKHDLYARAQWQLGSLGDESAYPVQTYNTPKQVATAVNSMWKGRRLMTPIGGGVEIRPALAVEDSNVLQDDGSAAKARAEVTLSDLPASQWWWD